MSPANPTARFLNFTHPIPRRMSEIGCSGIVEPRSESSNTWYRISICLPQGKHKVQLERASGTIYFLFSFFFFIIVADMKLKKRPPKGPVWIRFQERFAERMTSVSRGICGPSRFIFHPCLKAIMSTESVVACGKGIHRVPVGRRFDPLSNFISRRIARVTREIRAHRCFSSSNS